MAVGATPTAVATNPSVGGGILAGLGGLWGSSQYNSGLQTAAGAAGMKPVGITGPTGGVQGSVVNGAPSYNLNSPLAPNFNQFANLGQQFNTAAGANVNNPFMTQANNALSALKTFDPNADANQTYGELHAMNAPGQTDQTQAMLNYEQATGRGGLTQNGQLGDLGGLALAQQTADNGLRVNAQQLAMQKQQQLVANAGNLLQSGESVPSSYLADSLGATQGAGNINTQLLQMLQQALNGQNVGVNAGRNVAQLQQDIGANKGNVTGNLLGGLGNAFNQYGGKIGNWLTSGGVNPSSVTGLDPSMMSGLNSDLASSTGDTLASDGASIFGGGPSAAGGEAAGSGLGGGAAGAGAAGAGALAAEPGMAAIGTGAVDAAADSAFASASGALGSGGAGAGAGSAGMGAGLAAAAPFAAAALAAAGPLYGMTQPGTKENAAWWNGLAKGAKSGDPAATMQLLTMAYHGGSDSAQARRLASSLGFDWQHFIPANMPAYSTGTYGSGQSGGGHILGHQ